MPEQYSGYRSPFSPADPFDRLYPSPVSVASNIRTWEQLVTESREEQRHRHAVQPGPVESLAAAKKKEKKEKEKRVFWRWSVAWQIRNSQKRQREKLAQSVQESRAGVQTFLTLARFSISKAANTEPDPVVRRAKRRELQNKWRAWQRNLLNVVRS